MVIYIFSASFKGKEVILRERKKSFYYSLFNRHWAYKEIKMNIIAWGMQRNQNMLKPYLSFLLWMSNWMKWHVHVMMTKKKTWLYAPRQHPNMLEFCIVNWWNWGPRLGHFSWNRIQLFFSAKSTAVGDNWQ